MPSALGRAMDGVLFEMKKAHLAGARFARTLLKPFGQALTPARFNLDVRASSQADAAE